MSEAAAKSSFLAAAVDLDAVLDDLERVEEEQQQQLAAAKVVVGNGENGEHHDLGHTDADDDTAKQNSGNLEQDIGKVSDVFGSLGVCSEATPCEAETVSPGLLLQNGEETTEVNNENGTSVAQPVANTDEPCPVVEESMLGGGVAVSVGDNDNIEEAAIDPASPSPSPPSPTDLTPPPKPPEDADRSPDHFVSIYDINDGEGGGASGDGEEEAARGMESNAQNRDEALGGPDEGGAVCDASDEGAVGGARPKSKQKPQNNGGGDESETAEVSKPENASAESGSARRTSVGDVAPLWVPDSEASNCMKCGLKFNLVKRRHHCRGCGKVFCNSCCSQKHVLSYIDDGKPSRVCDDCKTLLREAEAASAAVGSPTKNPPAGVLKKNSVDQGSPSAAAAAATTPSENKQVMFSDGVRPGGDLTELDGSTASSPTKRSSSRKKGSKSRSRNTVIPHEEAGAGRSLLPENQAELPAIWGSPGKTSDEVSQILERGDTVSFIVNNNLLVRVKLVFYEPANKLIWNYCSAGLLSVGQDELVILISQCESDGALPNWHVFNHFQFLYEKAKDGPPVSQMGYSLLATDSLLGIGNSYGGFLYIRASFQSLEYLEVPPEGVPRIFGLLITKWELPWARLFPLRLMLRLGAEFRYYPAPLWSERNRPSVYNDIGNTMMKLLCDFRNYTYSLPIIHGLRIHMEKKLTKVMLPRNSYNSLHRALTNSNQPVLALGSVLSKEADSHLVAMQRGDEDDGGQHSPHHLQQGISQSDYETQAINIANKERVVTGASFIVFNGALKASTGMTAKSSIVEDGLMVQITQERMVELRKAMEKLEDFKIDCGPIHAETPDETISIEWTDDVSDVNEGVTSQVDLMKLEGVPSVRLHARRDLTSRGSSFFIRWTEVFFLAHSSDLEPSDHMTTASALAKAISVTLSPFLEKLSKAGMSTVAIRVNLDVEKVSYDAGANGRPLPSQMMKVLDDSLIPLIHYEAGNLKSCLELLFRILNC